MHQSQQLEEASKATRAPWVPEMLLAVSLTPPPTHLPA